MLKSWSRLIPSVSSARPSPFWSQPASGWRYSPRQETGLRWGGTVYTSKQEFNVYLRSKGLSYRIWLARNPGVAPWEPSAGGAASVPNAETSRPTTTGRSKLRAVEDWVARLPLSTLVDRPEA